MERERALRLQRQGIEAWIRGLASVAEGGELIEHEGVVAAIVPGAPRRSIVNSAVHRDAEGLERALPALADAYDRAGVAAVMWTIEPDAEAERTLAGAGYAFDGEPAAMVADLSELAAPELGELDWDAEATPEEVGRINDIAYGYPSGEGLSAAIGQPPPELNARSYRARAAGEVAAVLQTADIDGDCVVMWVATLPEHRGRRLASRLLQAALADARARGLETTSLQASMLGRGVYERIGYELVAPLRIHERRK
jgi:ribosomal protein S18 acetylase RimI-like enzyme